MTTERPNLVMLVAIVTIGAFAVLVLLVTMADR